MPHKRSEVAAAAAAGAALALLGIACLVSYIDRGNLSIAAPQLKLDLRISASQLGILLSSFFWTYTALQFVNGWLADRVHAGFMLAVGFLVWSLATAATGIVQGFTLLLAMRFLLGTGESVMFPSSSKILAEHVPEDHRGFANAVLSAGMKCGPAVGMLGAGSLMALYGWRPVFIGVGVLSLAWLPAWLKWMPRTPARPLTVTAHRPRSIDILRQRSFWGASAGSFCGCYLLYFMLTWLPFYLVHDRHLSLQAMASVAGLYYVVDAVAAIASGWLSDFLIRRGHGPTFVRKSIMMIGHTTAALALSGCAFADSRSYLLWLVGIGVGCGFCGSGIFAFAQTLSGPQAAGRWVGMQNGFGNLAGVIGPALTGFVLDWTGGFRIAIAIAAFVVLAGGFAWVFAIGPLQQIAWAPKSYHRVGVAARAVGGA